MDKQEFSGYDGRLSIGEKTIAFGNFKINVSANFPDKCDIEEIADDVMKVDFSGEMTKVLIHNALMYYPRRLKTPFTVRGVAIDIHKEPQLITFIVPNCFIESTDIQKADISEIGSFVNSLTFSLKNSQW